MPRILIKPLIFISLFICLTMSVSANNNIYIDKDRAGRTVFSDIPAARTAKLHKVSVHQPSTNNNASSTYNENSPDNTAAVDPSDHYKAVTIASPKNGSIIKSPYGTLEIKVNIDPGLEVMHKVQVVIDGLKQGANRSTRFKINGAEAGKHTVRALVLDQTGKLLVSSGTHTFTVQSPPVN